MSETLSKYADAAFTSITERIKELESCEFLLGNIIATLSIERNRQSMLDEPADALPKFCDIADGWIARHKDLKAAALNASTQRDAERKLLEYQDLRLLEENLRDTLKTPSLYDPEWVRDAKATLKKLKKAMGAALQAEGNDG